MISNYDIRSQMRKRIQRKVRRRLGRTVAAQRFNTLEDEALYRGIATPWECGCCIREWV